MGVTGLWPILQPCARPIQLSALNRKRLAVDASIWIYQFLKAVRDKEGNALRNSHVVGFFRRICKLLFYGIKPVFVFDGGAPVLKRQTVLGRKNRREGRREDAVRTAGRLLAVQFKRREEEEHERRKREKEREREGLTVNRVVEEEEDLVPLDEDLVYEDGAGIPTRERMSARKFTKQDAYHLPDLNGGIEGMGQPNDPRIMSSEELEEYARQFNSGEDVNLYDFSKIDFNGEFFMSLPAGDRYNILNAARLRSRLRMGLSKEQLEEMFPDRMAFSKFQIERVRERNELTQRLMNLNGMNGEDAMYGITGSGRIAGERGREYVLVKNDGVEGGWALGVVSTDKGVGERNKPIDVDALHQRIKEHQQDDESEDEFEDVPVEGLNRLPKFKADRAQNLSYSEFQAQEIAEQRQNYYVSRSGEPSRVAQSSRSARPASEERDSLFVDDDRLVPQSVVSGSAIDGEEEDLRKAITMSLQNEPDADAESDEEDHLNRAIALSLQQNHGQNSQSEDDPDFEDVPMPEYKQRAVQDPRPLTNLSGRMVAHIVNNRANAAVPKRRAQSVSSDSDVDLRSALAAARKQKAREGKRSQPVPVAMNRKNPFDGPLPFEKLPFNATVFGKKAAAPARQNGGNVDAELEDDLAGGFENNADDEASMPLPPWLTGSGDIRSQVQEQQKRDLQLNAEDREKALEAEKLFRKNHGPIEVESSDNDSDIEVLDAPPPPKKTTEKVAEMEVAEHLSTDTPTSTVLQDRPPSTQEISDQGITQKPNSERSDNEPVDWSESDYGDAIIRPAKAISSNQPTLRSVDPASLASKSPSPEFEDVEVPQIVSDSQHAPAIPPVAVASSEFSTEFPSKPQSPSDNLAPQSASNQIDIEQAKVVDDIEFDEFSDPEDEELLAQLAIEAEEHARFASTLNNKSEQENQAAYERELKALRSQQKKDRRDADEVSHVMITECQALLRFFGIPYITAPMEAEAECAELVRLGLVDGIVTDDSDIFLFGGTRVYKNMFNSNKFVECYLSADIEKELSLSRDQLISIAHLLGSDYTEGLPGIGPVTAVEILSEFSSPTGLQDFKDWWSSTHIITRPLSSETSAFRKKFRRSQATKLLLPPAFPSPAVTEAYLKPDVDSSPEAFQWGVPDLDGLRDFLMETIGWSQERTDEVLVPVIRDMNRREMEGTQSNITRYFDGAVGLGGNNGTQGKERNVGSKRMKEAVSKLKAKKSNLGGTFGEEAADWARKNDLSFTQREKEKAKKKQRGKKRVAFDVDEGSGVTDPEAEAVTAAREVEITEADDESGSGNEYQDSSARRPGKSSTNNVEKAARKRKRMKV